MALHCGKISTFTLFVSERLHPLNFYKCTNIVNFDFLSIFTGRFR